jgi:hypothetical protein
MGYLIGVNWITMVVAVARGVAEGVADAAGG